jgi:hypothetical protein
MILPIYEIAFDCLDPNRVAAFWRGALDYVQQMPTPEEMEAAYAEHPEWRDIAIVEDELFRHPRLYLQRVPEAKVGRNRIRFELCVPADELEAEIERLHSLGASQLDDEGWFADPEGNEFTVRGDEHGARRFGAVLIDAREPHRLASFWGQLFGFDIGPDWCSPAGELMRAKRGELIVGDRPTGVRVPGFGTPPDGPVHIYTPGFKFVQESAPKSFKNRIHFDLVPTDVDADRARAFSLGATPEDLAGTGHRGMFDPERNEFCLHHDSMFDARDDPDDRPSPRSLIGECASELCEPFEA